MRNGLLVILIGLGFFSSVGLFEDVFAGPPPTIDLTGTIRDFLPSHPDFEAANGHNHVTQGMVLPTIDSLLVGDDRNPTFNPDRSALVALPPFSIGHIEPVPPFDQMTGLTEFNQWFNDDAVNLSSPCTLTLTETTPGNFALSTMSFFPIDEVSGAVSCSEPFTGFGDTPGISPTHNYHFTYEIHTNFIFEADDEFTFTGDDDIWVFIDGQLALDLGGTHTARTGTITNADMVALGLEIGTRYNFDFFFAERQSTGSEFQFSTSLGLNSVIAEDDEFSTPADTVLNDNVITNTNPIAADSDPNGDAFTVTEVLDSDTNPVVVGVPTLLPSGALLTVASDGTLTYDPNGAFDSLYVGESDTDTFDYTITDDFGATDSATVTITIDGVAIRGTITVEKDTEPDMDDLDFDFRIFEGTTIIPDFTLCDNGLIGDCTNGNPATSDAFEVDRGFYNIEEIVIAAGYEVTLIQCTVDGVLDTTITDANNVGIVVADEEEWRCIFTNEPIPDQSITVIKDANPPIDADFAFVIDETSEAFFESFNLCDFTSTCSSGEDETSDTYDVPVGEFRIAEGDIPSGYSVSSITCDEIGGGSASNAGSNEIIFSVASGEQWECTFVNDLTIPTADYGDAPDSYSTLFASGGPHHLTDPGQTLGSIIDTENDGVPTADALGDDIADTDDEDGITLPSFFTPGTDADITINIQGIEEGASASVTGFIDFNRDGVFDDPSERVVEITRDINGDHVVPVSVPAIASAGDTYARFRIVEGISNYLPPTDAAPNGEVEDYATSIELVPCPEGPSGDDSTAGFLLGLLVPDMYRAFGGTPPPTSEPCADLSIDKTDNIDPVEIGTDLVYTITVSNSGPNDAENVIVTDTLPPGLAIISVDPSQGSCVGVTCNLGDILDGESANIVIVVRVFSPDLTMTNTAVVSSDTFDNNDANNIATENTNPCSDEESGDDSGPVRFLLGLLVPEHLMAFGGGPSYPPCTIPSDGNGGLPYPDPNLGDPKHGQGHSNGFCMNQTCMDVTGLFNHWPETNVPQGSTQSFTVLVACPRGAQTCNHIALAGALPDADFYDDRWTVTLQKQPTTDIWDISVMNDYGEIDEAGVTATVQPISQTMITATINVPFVIPGSIGTADGTDPAHENNRHLHVTVHDNHAGSSNYIFNEGMYVEDIYAYPQIETRFDAPLVYEQLCINEDEKDRRTCAFELVRQWTIEQAEQKLKELYDQKGQDMDSYDESEQN